VFFSVDFTYPFVFALFRADLLRKVDSSRVVSAARAFLSAIYTGKFVLRFGVFTTAGVRAFHRAVQRVSFEFFSVCRQVRQTHDERFSAFFADEVDRRLVGGGFSVFAVIAAAGQAAVFTVDIARIAVKQLLTALTDFLDRHGRLSLFGNGDQYACVDSGCQVSL
jgi:hypothetical protein